MRMFIFGLAFVLYESDKALKILKCLDESKAPGIDECF